MSTPHLKARDGRSLPGLPLETDRIDRFAPRAGERVSRYPSREQISGRDARPAVALTVLRSSAAGKRAGVGAAISRDYFNNH